MIGVNPLRTKVLITTDEVLFHGPFDNDMDIRTILQSIIIAERRFIKPLLGYKVYDALIDKKNTLVTTANKAVLQTNLNTGRGADRDIIVLNEGDYVNSDTYLDAHQLSFWNYCLHKLVAECVWFLTLPVNRSRSTAKGVLKNFPETIGQDQESASVDLKDLKHLMDKGLQERIAPLIEDMHRYLCKEKYPLYDKDCGCNSDGQPYTKNTGIILGMYDDEEDCRCRY